MNLFKHFKNKSIGLKNVINKKYDLLKKYSKEQIIETKLLSNKLSSNTVKIVHTNLEKIPVVFAKSGLSLSKMFLNHTKAGMYVKSLLYTCVIGTSLITVGSATYAYGTVKTDVVTISKIFNNGSSYGKSHPEYMVSAILDDTGDRKIFIVGVSYWHLMFRNFELWSQLQEGEKYKIKYYGISKPPFGIYQKIIKLENI